MQMKQIDPVELEQQRMKTQQTLEVIHTLSNLLQLDVDYRDGRWYSKYDFDEGEYETIKAKLLEQVNKL